MLLYRDEVTELVTSYPLRMPLVLSCCTGSQETWISKADSAVALMLEGPTVGSVRSQPECKRLAMCSMCTVSHNYILLQCCPLFCCSFADHVLTVLD